MIVTQRGAALALLAVFGVAANATAGPSTITGLIQNSAGIARNCVCTESCVVDRGCPEIGLPGWGSRVTARSVGPGGLCFCDRQVSPKKVRIEACLEDFAGGVPLVCSSGR